MVLHRQGDLQDRIGIYTLGDVAATSGAGAEGGSARSEKSGGSLRAGVGAGELSKFRARSNDVAGVQWLPGGTHVLTVDTPLQYRFCVYTPMGEVRLPKPSLTTMIFPMFFCYIACVMMCFCMWFPPQTIFVMNDPTDVYCCVIWWRVL